MKAILTIYLKELRDTLRDRRSLIRMFVVPLAIFPGLMGIMNTIQSNSNEKEWARELRVGYHSDSADLGLRLLLENAGGFKVFDVPSSDSITPWIRDNRLDLGVSLPPTFADRVENLETDTIRTYGPAASDIARDRLDSMVQIFQGILLEHRLKSLHLEKQNIEPSHVRFTNTATMRETIGKLAGGLLPYIFILFCYMGCMFPAIDLFTGEKERGTIETLLVAPVERWKILIGKMMLIVTAGLLSAVLSIGGLMISTRFAGSEMGVVVNVILEILSPASIASMLLMLVPLVIFFAGIMIPAVVYARTFKEAATTLQPLNFIVIIPAAIGMVPGIELNAATALIPILNVALTTKEIIAGTMNGLLFAEVLLSLIVIAAIAVFFSLRQFGNERNVLRG